MLMTGSCQQTTCNPLKGETATVCVTVAKLGCKKISEREEIFKLLCGHGSRVRMQKKYQREKRFSDSFVATKCTEP